MKFSFVFMNGLNMHGKVTFMYIFGDTILAPVIFGFQMFEMYMPF